MIADVRIRDYDGAMEVLNRVARLVEESHPDVLAWDCYFEESGERMTWFQEHKDQSTLLEYENAVDELGVLDEIGRFLDIERLVVLGRVTDPDLLEFFLRFPAVPVERTFGVSR
jgi:hypothetical protein